MWPSPSRSHTSLHALLCACAAGACALAAGCGDDGSCGPGSAAADGLRATSADVTLTYGAMTSRAGNDCPDASAPTGVVSLTIEGTQTDGTGLITFCIPRPDLLAQGSRTLGLIVSSADVRVIDLKGSSGACTYRIDTTRVPTGSAGGTGVCGAGVDPAGFAFNIDGAVSLRRTCGATVDTIGVQLTGVVAVAAE